MHQQGFLSRRRHLIIGILMFLFALGLLTSGGEGSGPVGRALGVVGAPVQMLMSGIANGMGGVVDHYIFLVGAREESRKLATENEALQLELGKIEEYRYENERLRTLLNLKAETEVPQIAAQVVGRSASAWYRTLVLDKGAVDGVRRDLPVIGPGGVVGRVYEVGGSACRVLLLTDASSAVDALVQRSRVQVVVEGNMTPRPRLLYLSRGTDAQAGDKVVTSGLDGIYPKGLILGEIGDILDEPSEIFLTAQLAPGADFSRIEEVFILLPGEQHEP